MSEKEIRCAWCGLDYKVTKEDKVKRHKDSDGICNSCEKKIREEIKKDKK